MTSKTLARRAGILAIGMTVAGLGLAAPASAASSSPSACAATCTATVEIVGFDAWYQGTVDNTYSAPGLTSWIWVGSNKQGGHMDYYLQGEGTMRKLYNPAGGSSSTALSKKVVTFRVCGPNYIGGDACGPWYIPSTS
ncbi:MULTISPECIES: hypothetical protein [Streptomyces]|uniref:Secreted protein n=1 Tax=Streptomyces canarius TaxID=285453 RepID=A0ABQ3D678_9ACTN|nr:hypothetical protein [Streptomyces canarius]GHA56685.1 hypothetical protein GCM10010345_71490 [Streptomyces canarius]